MTHDIVDERTLTSSHWGAMRVKARNGQIVDVKPFERDRDPSPIIQGWVDAFDHPTRVRRPAVRSSWLVEGAGARPELRGVDPFVEVTWDHALDLVANELKTTIERSGNASILGGSHGWSSAGRFHHAQSQLKRFLNGIGGFTDQVNGYSFATAQVLLPKIVGDLTMIFGPSTSWPAITENTRLFVTLGGLPLKNAQVLSGGTGDHQVSQRLDELAARNVRVVGISPVRDDTPSRLKAEWLAIRPGSDTALLLAMAHTLLEQRLHDTDFLDRCTVGFDVVARYLTKGRDDRAFDAEWASALTDLPPATIRRLACDLVKVRSFINLTWSVQRAEHGEHAYWAAITLAAMVGQIGLPGGGLGFGYGSDGGTAGTPVAKIKAPALPIGKNKAGSFIPAARVADLLAKPGELLQYDGQSLRLPRIDLVYWAGGNPFHHQQDLNKFRDAIRKPRTFVVHENFWTATARHADIVLPATTPLERNDLGASSSTRFLMAMKQAVEPLSDARSDHDILSGLARRLGVLDAFTEGLDEMGWIARLYETTRENASVSGMAMPSFDEFWKAGYFEYPPPKEAFVSFAAFRADPVGSRLMTESGKIELFSKRIASYGYEESPGHAAWFEPSEWLGSESVCRFPLHLISNQPGTRLHSQLDVVGVSRDSKIHGREPLRISAADARSRRIETGDIVRVFNERGACLAAAVVSHEIRENVVQLATGAWFSPLLGGKDAGLDIHGNPNVLTHDRGSSRFAQGPAAQSCLVEIERYLGDLPPLTHHLPPEFVQGDPG